MLVRQVLGSLTVGRALVVIALMSSLGGTGVVTEARAEPQGAVDSCPRVVVIGVRGSGQAAGYGPQVWDTVKNILPNSGDPSTDKKWLNYPARGRFFNLFGAFLQLSGVGLGAYHDSVNDGKTELRKRIETWTQACDSRFTKIVLVGYSQGAQVVADIYQEMWRQDSANTVGWIYGMVLFGDPYFNRNSVGTIAPLSVLDGNYIGSLGRRPAFPVSQAARILSYCHRGDPVCRGRIGLKRPHENYHTTGDAADAGGWLSTRLGAWARANPWPPAQGTIVQNSTSGASWLINERGRRNWIPTGGDWLCLRARGASVVSVRQATINAIPDEVGSHAICVPSATSGPPEQTPIDPGPIPSAPPGAPKPYAGNLVAVNYGDGHVGVAFDVGWQAGRDPVTCRFYDNAVEIFSAQCGTRASKQFYGLAPGRHTFHATVTDLFGVVSDSTNSVSVDVIASAPPPPPPTVASDRLSNDGRLAAASNEFLLSADGRYRFVMQSDSNLVLYGPSGRPIWSTNTVGRGANHLRMQGDGNLVMYNGANAAVWATNTPRHYSSYLVVQNDGNVVIYDGSTPIWSTNTAGRI